MSITEVADRRAIEAALSDPALVHPFELERPDIARSTDPAVREFFHTWRSLNSDRHGHFRSIASRAFSIQRAKELTKDFDNAASEIALALCGSRSFDLREDAIAPIVCRCIRGAIGYGSLDLRAFAQLSADANLIVEHIARTDSEIDLLSRTVSRVTTATAKELATRVNRSSQDLISRLAQDTEAKVITDMEAIVFASTMLRIVDPTINFVCNALNLALNHPRQLDRVLENDAYRSEFVELALRLVSPAKVLTRFRSLGTEQDVGHERGALMLMIGSANAQSEDHEGELINGQKNPIRSLTFGFGRRSCPGSAIVRSIAVACLKQVGLLFDKGGLPDLRPRNSNIR